MSFIADSTHGKKSLLRLKWLRTTEQQDGKKVTLEVKTYF